MLLCLADRALADPIAPVTPSPEQATRVVEELHATMLDTMKQSQKLGYEGRLARLQPAIAARYDFAFIAEKSVGLTWKELDAAQRGRLVDAITRLAGANYAARMEAFSGERFETTGTENASQNTILVHTRVVDADGGAIPLDYRLRAAPDGTPLIVDVFYDGTVSELAMRRSEYSALLKKGGIDALLAALEKKIAEQAIAKAS
jgi:phospholipid transport system substrate-binding protein